jgi:Na+/H+ antiporter NhaD/arsenite permease-like protein
MTAFVACIFIIVYLGMIIGRIPGLAIDRTGIAALGAIALIAGGHTSIEHAWQAIDVPTMGLLLGLMVASAQLRLGGLYTLITQRLAAADVGPAALLMLVIVAAAVLSAVLANDIVCLAMTPLLIEGCLRRGLRRR